MTRYCITRVWTVDADNEDHACDLADNRYPDTETITSRIDENVSACSSCGMAWFACGQSTVGRAFDDDICCFDCKRREGETHAR